MTVPVIWNARESLAVPPKLILSSNRDCPSTSNGPSIYASSPLEVSEGEPFPTLRFPVKTFTRPVAPAVVKVISPAVVVASARFVELADEIVSAPPARPVMDAAPSATTSTTSPTDDT